MPIEVGQPVAAPATEAKQRAQEDAAIAAEHERKVAICNQLLNPLGQLQRIVAQGRAVEQAGVRWAAWIVRRRGDGAGVVGAKLPDEAMAAQRCRQVARARLPARRRGHQSQVGRGVKNGKITVHLDSSQFPRCGRG